MTGFQIFHDSIFLLFAIVSFCEIRKASGPRKYIKLAIGLLAIVVVVWDILAKYK